MSIEKIEIGQYYLVPFWDIDNAPCIVQVIDMNEILDLVQYKYIDTIKRYERRIDPEARLCSLYEKTINTFKNKATNISQLQAILLGLKE